MADPKFIDTNPVPVEILRMPDRPLLDVDGNEIEIGDSTPLQAAADNHSGAMIALRPSPADLERLAFAGGEPIEDLHLTLAFLGEGADWSPDQRRAVVEAMESIAPIEPIDANAFGMALWNPLSDSPCWVLNVGGAGIDQIHSDTWEAIRGLPGFDSFQIPDQHQPWAAHVCLAYSDDPNIAVRAMERLGPIQFDQLWVTFANESTFIPLNATLVADAKPEVVMPWHIERNHADAPPGKPWAIVRDGESAAAGFYSTRTTAVARLRGFEADENKECPPGHHRMPDGECMPDGEMASADPAVRGVAIVEGHWTGDGRNFSQGALTWPDPAETSIPLQWQKETTHGGVNDNTVNVGWLTSLQREGDEIRVRGVFDTDSADGAEAARFLRKRKRFGVSIVADDPEQKGVEFVFAEGCGEPGDENFDEDNPQCWSPNVIYNSGRIRALTLVDTAAFVEAYLEFDEDADSANAEPVVATGNPEEPMDELAALESAIALVAASHTIQIPDVPPLEWFSEPSSLPEVGAIQVDDDGRIFGLLAPAGVAHRSFKERITVPRGNVDYSRWMNRATIVAGGERIATGPITMNCGHASTGGHVGSRAAIEHYDNSCSIVATVRVGENRFGTWIAGALLPDVTPEQVARILACQLSGDWRPHPEKPGHRELAGALLVPVPGFPVAANLGRLRFNNESELVASAVPVFWASDRPLQELPGFAAVNPEAEPADELPEFVAPAEAEPAADPIEAAPAVEADPVVDNDLPSFEEIQKNAEFQTRAQELAARIGIPIPRSQ